ncbi:MAG TPA: hypothetical protein VFT60_14635, partial [Bryobacteraceae bacterium]|nr:hypothetical protein [Bryobacteraceae bacterium]
MYVLYRLFFRDIAARDDAANRLASAGKPGTEQIRKSWQRSLLLNDSEANLLRLTASRCNQALDRQHTAALPAIQAARANLMSTPVNSAPPK